MIDEYKINDSVVKITDAVKELQQEFLKSQAVPQLTQWDMDNALEEHVKIKKLKKDNGVDVWHFFDMPGSGPTACLIKEEFDVIVAKFGVKELDLYGLQSVFNHGYGLSFIMSGEQNQSYYNLESLRVAIKEIKHDNLALKLAGVEG